MTVEQVSPQLIALIAGKSETNGYRLLVELTEAGEVKVNGEVVEASAADILTAVETLAGAVSGSEMQVDIVGALPAGTAVIGKVGHDKTGIGHGVKTVTTAGTDEALAASTAAKVVIIQAQTDNTGIIAVGASGVDATEATGTGIALFAGDSVALEIDNLADVYIDATVSGEGVRYTYLT